MKTKTLLAAIGFCFSAAAFAAMPGMEQNGMLVDAKGMTLYTYDKDSEGMSACNGKCAENWPPLMAASDAEAMGDWTVIKREDGSMQWAYDGHPLYTYVKDTKAGEMTGDGKGGTWKVAKP
jgi:predicted lipoprotein with Yx(FWY)xxD motif